MSKWKVVPAFSPSQEVYVSLSPIVSNACFDHLSASTFSCLNMCWKYIPLKEEINSLALPFQPSIFIAWRFSFLLSQSITILESPNSWMYWMSNCFSMKREAQAPNNLALVFVPAPPLKCHLYLVISLQKMVPPAPQFVPCTVKKSHWITIYGNENSRDSMSAHEIAVK